MGLGMGRGMIKKVWNVKHYFPSSVFQPLSVVYSQSCFDATPVSCCVLEASVYNRWQIVCLTNVLVGQAKEVAVGTAAVGEEGGGEHSSRWQRAKPGNCSALHIPITALVF